MSPTEWKELILVVVITEIVFGVFTSSRLRWTSSAFGWLAIWCFHLFHCETLMGAFVAATLIEILLAAVIAVAIVSYLWG